MQIAASLAVVRAAYAPPPVPRAPVEAPALPPATADATPAEPLWARWPAVQEPAGLPADDWARYSPGTDDLSRLTPGDRELLHAVTGTHVTSEGVVLGDAGGELDPLVTAVAQDRRSGALTRELGPEALAELVERIGVDVVDPGHLARADDFFAARDHRRAEDPHPRSSFTIDL